MSYNEESNNIELKSESVKEILRTPPKWIIRWGITIMAFVILVLLIGSYFYKYPDIIRAEITITSRNPPIPIVAKTSGKLISLFVKNKEKVSVDQIIGIIENPANFDNMVDLENKLENFKYFFQEGSKPEYLEIKFSKEYQLGSVHGNYASFVNQWTKHLSMVKLDYAGKQIESLQSQVLDYKIYLGQLEDQTFSYEKDLQISKNRHQRDSLLHHKGILSDADLESSKANYLKQEYGFKGSIANLTNIQLKINQLNQQILELKTKKNEQVENSLSTLKEKYEVLISQILAWKQNYLLRSSIEGTITFTNIWVKNQYIISGNTIFTVVPEKEEEIIGKVRIPVSGSGKVKIGQRVNIKLDNYPFMEYGMLGGFITNISLVPENELQGAYYAAEISLENKLRTNSNINLEFYQQMQGTAEIITQDKRLIHRFIQPLMALFKENF